MRSRFMIEDPGKVEATMKITMTLDAWELLRSQLGGKFPGWRLSRHITELLAQGRKVFHVEHEGESD